MGTEIESTFDECQQSRKDKRGNTTFASPLPQSSKPNQSVHLDLFGPLKNNAFELRSSFCVKQTPFQNMANWLQIKV
jgi:hypothetical protein